MSENWSISFTPPVTNRFLTARQCHALLEMCDHLQIPTVKDTIWRLARAQLANPKAVGLSPWETFKLGAIQDTPKLCLDAVSAFSRYGYTLDQICRQPAQFYEDVPGRYVALLLTENYQNVNGYYRPCSMEDIVKRFEKMLSNNKK
jgi:hypothetical protein